tara:strand:- start:543 stop:1868 length:1326 start_codon:yes stop_codon:yes gene_type:complete
MSAQEWQFDGLVGPTHNYAGLSYGNVASQTHAGNMSNPKRAALQGLDKMRFVASLGVKQAVMPPQKRPVLKALHALGFRGETAKMLEDAYAISPDLLASVYSASPMWAANAATVAPGADTADGRVHLVPANLVSTFHRSLEPEQTTRILRHIFADEAHFCVHDALPATVRFSDEGAANHMRVCSDHGRKGLHVYLYGCGPNAARVPQRFPARQNEEACYAIARLSQLDSDFCAVLQQDPDVIDAGVFHNDVIAMNNEELMIAHEHCFADPAVAKASLKQHYPALSYVEIPQAGLSVEDAVRTYFFNSQLLSLPNGQMAIVAPIECEEHDAARMQMERLVATETIAVEAVHYMDVRESMHNGGGPACLRLRVVLDEAQADAMHGGVAFDDGLYGRLGAWVNAHYRDRLALGDLRDPALIDEVDAAMAALEEILGLSGLYTAA